jgi:HK97 gp10 family phage protein
MGVGASISGANVIMQALKKKADEIAQGVADGVNETALQIHGDAVQNCPVDTGRLRSSVRLAKRATRDDAVAEVSTDVEYAEHVEYGTIDQYAQPFMQPALERHGPKLPDNIARQTLRRMA